MSSIEPSEMLQMSLSHFCEMFDMDRNKIYELAAQETFPAYKIKGRWYVDIPEFYKWRKKHGEPKYYRRFSLSI